MALVRYMTTTAGRATRIGAGLVLVVVGASLGGTWWILAAVGLLPIAAGLLNLSVGPAVPRPFSRDGLSTLLTPDMPGAMVVSTFRFPFSSHPSVR
jgi:hypothetical protein